MGNSSRFDIFLDCLWGVALLVAWHLLPFSSIATEDLGTAMGSPALWLHVTLLATFVYTYCLRLRRHIVWFRQARKNN